MDSQSFVGDFGLGLPTDNRFMNQLNLGGNMAMGGANDLMNPTGLDFSNTMMMMDPPTSLGSGGAGTSSVGMIDFPDELNSPKNSTATTTSTASTTTTANATTTATTTPSTTTGPSASSAEAIPFPASLNDPPAINTNVGGGSAGAGSGPGQFDLNGNASTLSAGNMNMGMNMNAMNSMNMMNMGMNPAAMAGFMPDMSMGMNMNPMFMTGGYPMQPGPNGMMMNMNPQMYFQPQQQQQQQYLRMLQQQRQFASMQQNAMMQSQQQNPNAAAVAQLQRQQQMQALQQQMALQNQNQQAAAAAAAAAAQQRAAAAQTQMGAQASTAQQRGIQQSTAAAANTTSTTTTTAPAPNGTGTAAAAVRQPWHSSADHALRKEMLNHIMRVLQSQKSNAPANWLQRLPEMARRLEEECYRISTSREEYANTSTLHIRLKNIVRAAQSQQRGTRPSPGSSASPASTTAPGGSANGVPQAARPTAAAPVPAPAGAQATSGMIPFPGADAIGQPSNMKPSPMSAQQPIQMPPELQGRPSLSQSSTPQAIPMPPELQNSSAVQRVIKTESGATQSPDASASASAAAAAMAAANQSRSAQFLRQFKARAQQVTSTLEEQQTREYHNKLQSMTTSDTMNANSRSVLQRQQQRLLLLRHAMWCKAGDGTCTATPNCGEMKRLWQHMGNCQETTSCSYSHCISSKYVLSHFQQCENPSCLVCQLLRFPVEVKEKNGSLMMDADRALQQIQAASERRQAQLQAQGQAQPPQQATTSQPTQPQNVQQHQPVPMPASLQSAPPTTMGQGTQARTSMQMATSTVTQGVNQQMLGQGMMAPNATAAPPANPPVSTEGYVPGLTEEENRQLALIQQRLRGVSLDQLHVNCKKLEAYAEQVRSQINAIMNECRQLLQLSNSTQDPAVKGQYEAQVDSKKAILHELNTKYKKCISQHRIVKHVINARIHGGVGAGLPAAPPPAANPVATQPTMNGAIPFPGNAVAMQPLAMPPGLQTQPAPPQPSSGSFTAQLQQAQSAMWQQPQAPVQAPVAQNLLGAPKQLSPDELLDEGMSSQTPAVAPVGMMPMEMPSDLKSDTPAAFGSFGAAPEPANTIKAEAPVNPLTMNNSKLNAMMKKMDSDKNIKAETGPAVDTSSSTAPAPSPMASPQANGAASGDVPTSMLNELSNDDLKKHIDSLVLGYNATMQPATLKKRMEGLLKGMMEHKFGWVFSSPVDPVALGIPNYFKIIRRPMDLGTIKKKLDNGIYKHLDQFAADVRLTFENAKTYNSEEQDVYNLARDMLNDFNAEMRKVEAEVQEEERAARLKESACRLCGIERMVFEPAVLYCNGECNSRIRRNCYYFCSPDNKYHCCQPCFTALPDSVRGNEGKTYTKKELTKKKNDDVHEEPWVQCDTCNRWVHQVCALFNGKIDAEKKPQVVKSDPGKSNGPGPGSSHSISSTPGSEFLCPECLLDHRIKEPEKYPVGKHVFNARDLMRTKLSDFLERRIYKALQDEREDEARWTNRNVKEVVTAEHLTVRLVSNIEKQLMVRDKMFQRYKDTHKYTSEHRFKSKCICMFQEIHGVSVLLFGMYVHEFDEQEAECNSRRVYISYLDSVNYFEPAHLRTKVYHELLIAYLEFVRQRGFHTAHLWACPPLKGDDYILYCHPESQKTPKSDRLRQWYVDMLTVAQKDGVVLHISNLYDEYWRNDNSACLLPYFEGDYWVGLAEEVIEKLESEKPKKAKKGNKRKSISETKKMSKKAKTKKTKRRKTSTAGTSSTEGENDTENGNASEGENVEGDDADEGAESAEETTGSPVKKESVIASLDDVDKTVTDPLMVKIGEVIEPMKDDFLVVKLQPYCRVCNKPVIQGTLWKDPTTSTELGLNPKVVKTTLCDGCYQKAKASPSAKVQEQLKVLVSEEVKWPEKCADPDEINDSEYFDTRQAFLSLCQGNHYQFDELRRAKHSSMMALYHLGNPNPNAYVYECNSCTRDIVSGNRWHCHTCPDFDVCDACYAKEKHEHPLEKIPTSGVAGTAGKGQGAHGPLTEEQRRLREQRAKNVRLHMQLLVHASGCDGSCGSANCEKMKELMRHGAQCKQRALGGCTVCRRVWALLQLHARQCRQYECKVPRCHDLREHVRKLQLQQQLMDDRRRAAVTQQYRQMQNGTTPQAGGGDEDPTGGA